MRVKVLGGGFYGTHLALSLLRDGHDVVLWETAERLFSGASGNMPARLHGGAHYPRSKLTRSACQGHFAEFMANYGQFTHGVPCNVYAVAEHESLLDFGTYKQVLGSEIEFVTVARPAELGLQNIEGAILTGERHVHVDRMRDHFAAALDGHVVYGAPRGGVDDPAFDLVVDATFCTHEQIGIDRFEACLTVLLEGPVDRSVTIMDGALPSLYVWDENQGLCSLTSAKWTPLARRATWKDARHYLDHELSKVELDRHANEMFDQMAGFYPRIRDEYKIVDYRTAIRAMPRSAADARLVDIIRVGERAVRIRAGKLDAIFHAERAIKAMIAEMECRVAIAA